MDFDYSKYAENVSDAIAAASEGDIDKVGKVIHEATAPITGAIATEFVRKSYNKLFNKSAKSGKSTATDADETATTDAVEDEPFSMTRSVGRLNNTDVFDSIGLDDNPVSSSIERPTFFQRGVSAIRRRLSSIAESARDEFPEVFDSSAPEPSLYDAPEPAPGTSSNVIGDVIRGRSDFNLPDVDLGEPLSSIPPPPPPADDVSTSAGTQEAASEAANAAEEGGDALDTALTASTAADENPIGLIVTGGIALADLFANIFGHEHTQAIGAGSQFGITR